MSTHQTYLLKLQSADDDAASLSTREMAMKASEIIMVKLPTLLKTIQPSIIPSLFHSRLKTHLSSVVLLPFHPLD